MNVIHGEHEAVDFICDNPDIRAISFVGSDQAVGTGRMGAGPSVYCVPFSGALSGAELEMECAGNGGRDGGAREQGVAITDVVLVSCLRNAFV